MNLLWAINEHKYSKISLRAEHNCNSVGLIAKFLYGVKFFHTINSVYAIQSKSTANETDSYL